MKVVRVVGSVVTALAGSSCWVGRGQGSFPSVFPVVHTAVHTSSVVTLQTCGMYIRVCSFD